MTIVTIIVAFAAGWIGRSFLAARQVAWRDEAIRRRDAVLAQSVDTIAEANAAMAQSYEAHVRHGILLRAAIEQKQAAEWNAAVLRRVADARRANKEWLQ